MSVPQNNQIVLLKIIIFNKYRKILQFEYNHYTLPNKTMKMEAAQSCSTLCEPMGSLPGSSVHGIFQARLLEQVAISFYTGIFLAQGLNLCLLYWQADSLPLHHLGSPHACTHIYNYFCVYLYVSLFNIEM